MYYSAQEVTDILQFWNAKITVWCDLAEDAHGLLVRQQLVHHPQSVRSC